MPLLLPLYIWTSIQFNSIQLSISITNLQDTLHMVRSASRSAPSTGNPTSSSNPASTSPSTAAAGTAAARGAPSNYATGQNFGSDPLAQLNRADYAGPHMANLNPFQGLGINTNDPNVSFKLDNRIAKVKQDSGEWDSGRELHR